MNKEATEIAIRIFMKSLHKDVLNNMPPDITEVPQSQALVDAFMVGANQFMEQYIKKL